MVRKGFQRSVNRVLGAGLGAGALATGYGVVAVWLITGIVPAALVWWLILPLALLVAMLAAALMAAWEAAPALAAWRALGALADDLESELRATDQPHVVTMFDGQITGPVVDEYPPDGPARRRAA